MTLQNGKKVELSSLQGQPVVVYFYPKDDTRGCTIEAEGIRDAFDLFRYVDLRIFGVSTQDAASHQAFIDKYQLPFDLVVDTKGEVARAFRVPLKEGLAARQTFLIDKYGFIDKVWLNVDPNEHAEALMAAIPH